MKFILGFLVIAFIGPASWAKNCQEKQGALDFGSGTTKAFAAVVDVCNKKIIEVIFEDRLPLALNEAVEKSAGKEIPKDLIDQALPQFQEIVQKMRSQRYQKYPRRCDGRISHSQKWS